MSDPTKSNPADEPLRPHTYDGIQEFDKRLPNWWLFTLYGAIAFSVVYWLFYHFAGVGRFDKQTLAAEMEIIQAQRLEASLGVLDDSELWRMSRNSQLVEAGKATYTANCVPCHLASLKGKAENPAAQGPSLVDNEWIHGSEPSTLRGVITNGVQDKGMPTWGPVLGDKKIVEVLSYILSHHQPPAGTTTP